MTEQRAIAVLGGGSFGTAVANLLAENGHRVHQWMRDPEQAEAIRLNRENPRYLKGIKIHPGVEPVTDLQAALEACELCFVALPSSALRSVLAAHAERLSGKMLVSLTKGIAEELREENSKVYICALCPGPVNTEFNDRADVTFSLKGISPAYCVQEAFAGMKHHRTIIVPSPLMRFCTTMQHLVPDTILLKVVSRQQRKKTGH